MSMAHISEFSGFQKVGEYCEVNADPQYKQWIPKKSEVKPIVYLLVVNEEVKYIGETRRGYGRPLSYHKNQVMRTQREGIAAELEKGNKVEVFAIDVPAQTVSFNGETFTSYLAQDYEKSLIEKYNPLWNGRV